MLPTIGLAGRVTAAPRASGVEEIPDTTGQDALERKRRRKPTDSEVHKQTATGVISGDAGGKGETVG